jgi:hypothetical protein
MASPGVSEDQRTLPNFFIVGAPRCGTSSMWRYLNSHPDVYMSYLKEPTYFGSDLTKIPNEFLVRHKGTYLDLFRPGASKRIRGEASVMYLLSKKAAEEIYEFNPSARILIMLRDPVEMIQSYHGMLHNFGFEDIANFEEALATEPFRRRGERIPPSTMVREALYYSEVALLSAQVERFLHVFPKDQVKIVLFDKFATAPAECFFSVLDFLGLRHIAPKEFAVINAHTAPRSLTFAVLVQRPPGVLKFLLHLVPLRVRIRALYRLLSFNSKRVKRDPISSQLKQRLQEQLAPDVRKLAQLINRDLSAWLRDSGNLEQPQAIDPRRAEWPT